MFCNFPEVEIDRTFDVLLVFYRLTIKSDIGIQDSTGPSPLSQVRKRPFGKETVGKKSGFKKAESFFQRFNGRTVFAS